MALDAAIEITSKMTVITDDVIDAPPHGVASTAPCPIDTSPALDPLRRDLYVTHGFARVSTAMPGDNNEWSHGFTMTAGHARYVATLEERIDASARGGDWPADAQAFDLGPSFALRRGSIAHRDVDPAAITPISYHAALAELRGITDPAWWTWDLVVIFGGGGDRPDGAHLSGHAYVIDYRVGHAVCVAYFDVRVGEASHYDQERAVDAVLPLLRAVR